jgi:hypothetical protein
MSEIPGANVPDDVVRRIEQRSLSAAQRIRELSAHMNELDFSDLELVELCCLLREYGEQATGELLLRAAALHDDGLRAEYRAVFGLGKEESFRASIEQFESQFGVKLLDRQNEGFLVDSFTLMNTPGKPWSKVGGISTPLIARFLMEPSGAIIADVSTPDVGACALPLNWDGQTWRESAL